MNNKLLVPLNLSDFKVGNFSKFRIVFSESLEYIYKKKRFSIMSMPFREGHEIGQNKVLAWPFSAPLWTLNKSKKK